VHTGKAPAPRNSSLISLVVVTLFSGACLTWGGGMGLFRGDGTMSCFRWSPHGLGGLLHQLTGIRGAPYLETGRLISRRPPGAESFFCFSQESLVFPEDPNARKTLGIGWGNKTEEAARTAMVGLRRARGAPGKNSRTACHLALNIPPPIL